MSFTTISPSSDEKMPDLVKATELALFRSGIEVSDMRMFLLETKGMIAGSFTLSVLLSEMKSELAFVPGDIDIWAAEKPIRTPEGYRLVSVIPHWNIGPDNIKKLFAFKDNNLSNEDVKTIVERYKDDRMLWAIPEGEDDPYARLRASIKTIHRYTAAVRGSGLPDLQVIVTKNPPLEAIESFDIDVCQVLYDGNVFQIHSDLSVSDICKGSAALTGVSSSLQSNKEWIRTLRRLIKYAQRGFRFDVSNFISNVLEKKKFSLLNIYEWNSVATINVYGYPYGVVHPRVPVFFDGWTHRLRNGVVVGSGATANVKKNDVFKNEVSFGFLKFSEGKIVHKVTLWRGQVGAQYDNFYESRMCVFLLDKFVPEGAEDGRDDDVEIDLTDVEKELDVISTAVKKHGGGGKGYGSDDEQ